MTAPVVIGLSSHLHFFRGERCNATLGGVRSIQVSYGGIGYILTKLMQSVKKKRHIFCGAAHILSGRVLEREGRYMRECNDPTVDLDDLIFDEDPPGDSQR